MRLSKRPAWLTRWQQADDDVLLYVDQTLLLGSRPRDDEQEVLHDPDDQGDLLLRLAQEQGIPCEVLDTDPGEEEDRHES